MIIREYNVCMCSVYTILYHIMSRVELMKFCCRCSDLSCDGCWLRVCEGKIRETRYKIDKDTDKMEVTSDETYEGMFICISHMYIYMLIHI